MKTAYLAMIDESALKEHLTLERIGEWEGHLPFGDIAETVRTDRFSNCTQLQANGSMACYNVMDGLQSPEEFADGMFFDGMQYLPIAAFYERLYEPTMERVAETLAQYDVIVARVFERGAVHGARGLVGQFSVEFYGDDLAWCGYGHFGEEVVVWRVVKPEILPVDTIEEVADETASPAEQIEGGGEDAEGDGVQEVSPPRRRRRRV